jgi:hypothetical protein
VAPLSSAVRLGLSHAFVGYLYASWPRLAVVVRAVKGVLRGAQDVAPERRQAATGDERRRAPGWSEVGLETQSPPAVSA